MRSATCVTADRFELTGANAAAACLVAVGSSGSFFAVAGLGAQQRGIEQEGITALQKQFEQERQFPYTQLQFQQGLLQGLPVGTTSVTPNLSDLAKAGITGEQMRKIYDLLKGIPGFGG